MIFLVILTTLNHIPIAEHMSIIPDGKKPTQWSSRTVRHTIDGWRSVFTGPLCLVHKKPILNPFIHV